jgi:hypothetical protein
MQIHDDMDPECIFSGHESLDIFQYEYVNAYLGQWYIIMLMLDYFQVPDWCTPCFRHTHSIKYFICHKFQLHTLGGILLHIILVTPVIH